VDLLRRKTREELVQLLVARTGRPEERCSIVALEE
jgi:hypothetical protein